MKSIKDAILARHTTIKYNPNYIVSDSDIDEIIKLTQLAPSSLGMQQGKLVVIKKKELKENLLQFVSLSNRDKVLDSSVLFIVTGLTKEFFQNNNYQELVDRKIKFIRNTPQEIEATRKEWGSYLESKPFIEDIRFSGILSSYITLLAASMDLNSTIMAGFKQDEMTNFLKQEKIIDKFEYVQLLIAVGKEDENFEINKLSKQHRIRVKLDEFAKKIY